MATQTIEGVQLPVDGLGKITGAFTVALPDGNTVYLPTTTIVDAAGFEIGGVLVSLMQEILLSLKKIEHLAELSTAVLTD